MEYCHRVKLTRTYVLFRVTFPLHKLIVPESNFIGFIINFLKIKLRDEHGCSQIQFFPNES